MAFTKIAAAGIGSTETVTLHSLEVLNNATVGGVLTYEDVTNVDSIGIITARAGVLVGSGITLSKDGDIFATGVTTATKFVGDGSELTGVASTENIRTNTNATFLQNINVSGTATVGGNSVFSGAITSFEGASFAQDISIAETIKHTGDTNTRIKFPASDKVTVETSAVERLAIEPAGNVNIPKSVVVGTGLTVGAAVTISESGIEASGIGITCASINGAQIGGRRNIIINGAMRIAQRAGDNVVTTNGYGSVDRFAVYSGSTDEAPSHNRQDGNTTASGDNPFLVGLPKSLRIRNGNQTSGAQAGSYIFADYRFEASQMRNCGWNYVSPSSFVTLSFYVKSGVAQTYYGHVKTSDGTAMNYPFDIPVAAANTWYRIVKKIPGHANLQFDDSNDIGFRLTICPFMGTTYTGSINAHEWSTYSGSTRTPDNTTTWYTTDNATFLITGVQLEVGGQVTPFEHTSISEEMNECFRYYRLQSKTRGSGREGGASSYVMLNSFPLSPQMRNTPTVAMYGSANYNSNVSSIGTVNLSQDHIAFTASISDDNYWYYNNGWTADAEL